MLNAATAPPRRSSRHALIAGVDLVLLITYVILQEPGGATGFIWHEWVGVVFIPLFVLHVVLSWSWIATNWQRAIENSAPRARINYILNTTLFVLMAIVGVTGLVVSQYALPAIGAGSHGSRRWEQFHNFSASLVIPVVALHLALNWSWIVRAVRRYLFRRGVAAISDPPSS